jgi:hypothetical protein
VRAFDQHELQLLVPFSRGVPSESDATFCHGKLPEFELQHAVCYLENAYQSAISVDPQQFLVQAAPRLTYVSGIPHVLLGVLQRLTGPQPREDVGGFSQHHFPVKAVAGSCKC